MTEASLNIEKDNDIEPDNGRPNHLFRMASSSFDEGLIPSNIMNPEIRCAVQDIGCATLDIIGDWTYLFYLYFHAHDIDDDNQSQYMMFSHCVLAVSIYGTILSCWAILLGLVNIRHNQLGGEDVPYASFDRTQCTVPRIAMWMMVFHHVPVFILTTRIDMRYFEDMTIAGWFNFGTSMLALLNSSFFTLSGCCGDTMLDDNTTLGDDSKTNSSMLDYVRGKGLD